MEALINTHTPKRIFVGDRPTNPQEVSMFTSWMLIANSAASQEFYGSRSIPTPSIRDLPDWVFANSDVT